MIEKGDILQIDLVNPEQGNPEVIQRIKSAFSGKVLTASTDGQSQLTLEFNGPAEIGADSAKENVLFETLNVPKSEIARILLNGSAIKLKEVANINGDKGLNNPNITTEKDNGLKQSNPEESSKLDGILSRLFNRAFKKKKVN